MDAHRFGDSPPVLLAGVVVDKRRGVQATSDGDVVAHAVTDALLAAAALEDIGAHFPSTDPQWEDADSMELLAAAVDMVRSAGWEPFFCDVTVIAEKVRVSPHRLAIREALAAVMALPINQVSVKATTTDGMGWLGQDQGIVAVAVASLSQ